MIGTTYDSDNQTEPPHAFVQDPNAVAEKSLDDERDERVYCWAVYGRESGVSEAVKVAESGNEPIVDVTRGEGRLSCLNKKDEISW